MRLILLVACTLALVCTASEYASADYYGGVSIKYEQKMKRYVHAWFDRFGVGVADRMVGVVCHESGYNPIAVNYAGPVAGLFQIRYPVWSPNNPAINWHLKKFWHFQRYITFTQFYQRLKDPIQSIRLAFLIYKYHGDQWAGTC